MRYAFRGEEPPKVETTAKGADKAAYFAYLTVAPIIRGKDSEDADDGDDSERFRRAAKARWNKDATHDATHNATHDATHDAKSDASLLKEEKKNRGKEEGTAASRAPAHAKPTQQQFVDGCLGAGVPEDFARSLFAELEGFGWKDGDGRDIGSGQRYAKRTYLERRREAAAAEPTASGFRRISEADL
jgi:hypothetical protein